MNREQFRQMTNRSAKPVVGEHTKRLNQERVQSMNKASQMVEQQKRQQENHHSNPAKQQPSVGR